MKTVKYRVYDRNGRYHHSYLSKADAINCASLVYGSVKEIVKDCEEEFIFKQKKP